MTRTLLTEAGRVLAEASGAKSGRLNVQIITPGWGSSGYYSADVLEAAATDKVFPAGTHMYLDHPTEAEDAERPGRSVKDLAAVLLEDATWNGGALVAPVRTFGPYREAVAEMSDAIGVSIRSTAEVSEGDAEGRHGVIVEKLVEARSVDFVTAAGRGGKILEVLESARENVVKRAVTRGVTEATANETREQLQAALTDKLGGDKIWIWVRDFDDTTVWYEHETPDSSGTFQLAYTLGETGPAELDGDPVEVRAQTTYTPITTSSSESSDSQATSPAGDPATSPAATEDSTTTDPAAPAAADPAAQAAESTSPLEEDMTDDQGAAGSAPLTSVRQIIDRELAESRRELATVRAREQARRVLGEALREQWVPPATVTRITEELMHNLPMTPTNELDEAALIKRAGEKLRVAEQELAEALQAAGMGRPRDLGYASESQVGGLAAPELDRRLEESFKDLGLPENTAKIAAKGRG